MRQLGTLGPRPYFEQSLMGYVDFSSSAALTVLNSRNVSSVSKSATGDYVITVSNPLSTGISYALALTGRYDVGTGQAYVSVKTATVPTGSSFEITASEAIGDAAVDLARVFVSIWALDT